MGKGLWGLLVILLPVAMYAQSRLDSLIAQLDKVKDEQVEMDINEQILEFYVNQNLSPDTLLVRTLNRQGFLNWRTNPQVLDSLSAEALNIAERISDPFGVANSTFMQGFYYDLIGEFDTALDRYFDALARMDELGRVNKTAVISEYIGIVYRYTGQYDASLDYYLRALSLYESLKDSARIGNAYNSLGNLFYDQLELQKAEEYYEKALIIKRKYGSPNSVANTLGNLSAIYFSTERYQKALELGLEVLEIKKQLNNLQDLAISYVTVGHTYENLGDVQKMDSMISLGVALDYQLDNKRALSGDLRELAHAKRLLKRYDEAREILEEAEYYSKTTDAPNSLRSVYIEYIMIDTTLRDYRSAFDYLTKVIDLNDELSNEEIARNQARLEAEYEFNKEKDSIAFANSQELVVLETQLQYQKRSIYYFIGGLVLMCALLGLIYLLYRTKSGTNEKLRRLNMAIQQQNVEINTQKKELERAIRTKDQLFSMIAHDLRGPMSVFQGSGVVVKSLLEEKEFDNLEAYANLIEERSTQVTHLLDNLLNWALSNGNQFRYEPKQINLFQSISKDMNLFKPLADSKQIQIELQVPHELEAWVDENSFDGIVRNLHNNAIKFTPEKGTIRVKAQTDGSLVMIAVEDTGVGMPEEKIQKILSHKTVDSAEGTKGEKGTGLGLKLVHDFVKLNKGEMQISSVPGKGTVITISLPRTHS